MKKVSAVLLMVFMLVGLINANAGAIDLTSYTDQELDELSVAIETEKERRMNDNTVDWGDYLDTPTVEDVPIEIQEAVFEPIQLWSRGEQVVVLQEKLNELGFSVGRADGMFGERSSKALKDLQNTLGFEGTGMIESQEEFTKILGLVKGDGNNLLADYDTIMRTSPYYLDEELDGQAVLYFDYRNSEGENYINVARFDNVTEPEANTDYTLSFMAKGVGTIYSFFYPETVAQGYSNKGGSTNDSDGYIATELSDDWTFYKITWRTIADVNGVKNVIPVRVFKGSEVWVSKIKLEKGSFATVWTLPAINE